MSAVVVCSCSSLIPLLLLLMVWCGPGSRAPFACIHGEAGGWGGEAECG